MKANTASIISQSGGIQAGSAREQSAPPLEVERDPYSPARSRPGGGPPEHSPLAVPAEAETKSAKGSIRDFNPMN